MLLRNGLLLAIAALSLLGCASKQAAIDTQTSAQQALENRVAQLEAERAAQTGQMNQLDATTTDLKRQLNSLNDSLSSQQSSLTALSSKVDSQATAVAQAKQTADDAMKIARDSRLVTGKVIDSLLLTDDMVLYNYEQPELTGKGRAALDELIKRDVPQLPYIFIEIIGYSDDMSLGSQNRQIALERAESVRRYLFEVGGVPLHRMSVISFGDLKPIASNETIEGRNRNHRVMVRVLK